MTENSNCPVLSLRSINWTTIGTKGESLAMPIAAQMDACRVAKFQLSIERICSVNFSDVNQNPFESRLEKWIVHMTSKTVMLPFCTVFTVRSEKRKIQRTIEPSRGIIFFCAPAFVSFTCLVCSADGRFGSQSRMTQLFTVGDVISTAVCAQRNEISDSQSIAIVNRFPPRNLFSFSFLLNQIIIHKRVW